MHQISQKIENFVLDRKLEILGIEFTLIVDFVAYRCPEKIIVKKIKIESKFLNHAEDLFSDSIIYELCRVYALGEFEFSKRFRETVSEAFSVED